MLNATIWNAPYYERGSSQFLLGLLLLLLPITLIAGGFVLYKRGKIAL